MKSNDNNKKFEVRGAQYRALGKYSEDELLEKILAGKFTGEEDVRDGADSEWQKLASHPRFYDAFLRRLFGGEYQAPSIAGKKIGPGELTRQAMQSDAHTRQHVSEEPSEEDEDDGSQKTRQLGEKHEAHGATFHQSDIDALFTNGSKSGSKSRSKHTRVLSETAVASAEERPQKMEFRWHFQVPPPKLAIWGMFRSKKPGRWCNGLRGIPLAKKF